MKLKFQFQHSLSGIYLQTFRDKVFYKTGSIISPTANTLSQSWLHGFRIIIISTWISEKNVAAWPKSGGGGGGGTPNFK